MTREECMPAPILAAPRPDPGSRASRAESAVYRRRLKAALLRSDLTGRDLTPRRGRRPAEVPRPGSPAGSRRGAVWRGSRRACGRGAARQGRAALDPVSFAKPSAHSMPYPTLQLASSSRKCESCRAHQQRVSSGPFDTDTSRRDTNSHVPLRRQAPDFRVGAQAANELDLVRHRLVSVPKAGRSPAVRGAIPRSRRRSTWGRAPREIGALGERPAGASWRWVGPEQARLQRSTWCDARPRQVPRSIAGRQRCGSSSQH